jgi:hypothetical protein
MSEYYDFDVVIDVTPIRRVAIATKDLYGYWECADGTEGGSLAFQDKNGRLELIDYDGAAILPEAIVNALYDHGYVVYDFFDTETVAARKIKAEYLASGCQSSDVDEAMGKLREYCGELFENDHAMWSFLMEEPHEATEGEGAMRVSIDGGLTWLVATQGVRVIWSGLPMEHDGSEIEGEVHLNCTHEGMITDLYDPTSGENIGTDSTEVANIVARLIC